MTIHIQMLQDIATHARAMADSMQAIVDDCAEQLARRKATGESEESIMNEPFTIAALKDDFNALLAALRSCGLMVTGK